MTKSANPFATMPRCGAKRRNGAPCQRPGNKRNGRCRLHGGNAGAPSGPSNGNWVHGGRSKAVQAYKRNVHRMLRKAEKFLRGGK